MRKYPPSTIYRYLYLPSTQIIRTHHPHIHPTNPPLQTQVQHPYQLPTYTNHITASVTQHALSSPQLTYDMTTYYIKTDELSPTALKQTGHNSRKTQSPLSLRSSYPQNILLMGDRHNIPKGKMHNNCRLLPGHVVCTITLRNNIRRANICDPALQFVN